MRKYHQHEHAAEVRPGGARVRGPKRPGAVEALGRMLAATGASWPHCVHRCRRGKGDARGEVASGRGGRLLPTPTAAATASELAVQASELHEEIHARVVAVSHMDPRAQAQEVLEIQEMFKKFDAMAAQLNTGIGQT